MKVEELMNKDFVTIPHDATVADAINIIRKRQIHEVLVTKNGGLFGLVSSRQIIERSTRLNEKISTITVSPMVLEKELELEYAAEKLLFGGQRGIPVVDGNVLVGVVSEIDVINALGKLKRQEIAKIAAKDCMSPIKFVCGGDCAISDVRKSMIRHNVNRVPVVDKEGKIAGIVSTIDLLGSVVSEKGMGQGNRIGERIVLDNAAASSLMTKAVFSVGPDETALRVIELVAKNRISSVIVEESGKPVGIITPKNILRLVYKPKSFQSRVEITGVEDREMRHMLADFAQSKIKKLERFAEINSVRIGIKELRKEGRAKYEVKGRLATGDGTFFASCTEWNMFKGANELLEKLGKEASKKSGRRKS